MAATGNEVVLIRQAKIMYDELAGAISEGALPPGGVTTGDIANSAVTSDKIAADAVTGDKIASGAVTSDSIANGTITAADIADGVIPDVSGFITTTTADSKYAAKSHTHANATTSADGFMSSEDKVKLNGLSNYTLPTVSDTDFKSYLGIS